MYSPIGALQTTEKAKMRKNDRCVGIIMVLMAVAFVIAGCASRSKMSVPSTENALSSPKFDFFVVSFPYSNPDSERSRFVHSDSIRQLNLCEDRFFLHCSLPAFDKPVLGKGDVRKPLRQDF